ncbi:MAG: hypothetical protein LBR22_11370 [Desulfovibrio sp.]|jgi:hypothetical protein|nr:hypothetical protein [Desulfovibrio sp.]
MDFFKILVLALFVIGMWIRTYHHYVSCLYNTRSVLSMFAALICLVTVFFKFYPQFETFSNPLVVALLSVVSLFVCDFITAMIAVAIISKKHPEKFKTMRTYFRRRGRDF